MNYTEKMNEMREVAKDFLYNLIVNEELIKKEDGIYDRIEINIQMLKDNFSYRDGFSYMALHDFLRMIEPIATRSYEDIVKKVAEDVSNRKLKEVIEIKVR